MPGKFIPMKTFTNIQGTLKKYWKSIAWDTVIIVCVGVGLAMGIRYNLRSFISNDFDSALNTWYTAFLQGGAPALSKGVTNYPPLYEYILLLSSIFFRHYRPVIAVKLPFMACDFLCAWYIYRIVRI